MARRLVLPAGTLLEGELDLPDSAAVHVRDVLRLGAGAALSLTDGEGTEADAELVATSKRGVRVRVGPLRSTPASATTALVLYQCVGKGEKVDHVVRQVSELGARVIVPVISARSVARREAKIERWRAIADDATRVSGRCFRPRVEPVVALDEVLARQRAPLALCLAGGAPVSLGALLDVPRGVPATVEVLIGPEGGLDPAELEAAAAAGFSLAHLGEHTLRTETAGPAVVAILLYWAGALAR